MRHILVAIDNIEGTTAASPLIQQSLALARAFRSKIWLLHVVPQPGVTPFTVARELLRGQAASELSHEHRALHALTGYLRDSGVEATALLVEGPTVKTLLNEAERLDADLVVVNSHRHTLLYRALLDGAGERLLNESPRPVLFVPEDPQRLTDAAHREHSDLRQPQRGE